MWRGAVLGLALVLATGASADASAAPFTPAQTAAAERVVESYQGKGLTDAIVLIARGDRPVFRKSFGLADREHGIRNAADTEFRIGSITKQFTAVAILQLAAAGKLSLDDPATKFIDEAPPAWRAVTIRHLLTHTSGIPDFLAIPEWDTQPRLGRPAGDVVRFLRDRPLESPPGTRFAYDNTGYVLLGMIVAKAGGTSFGRYLAAHVFRPLGMRHSAFVDDAPPPRAAKGSVHEGGAWNAAPWMSGVRESGAGALYSTADDLLIWRRALDHPGRLGLKDLAPMFTDYGHGYGFGYVVRPEGGRPVQWHNGHVNGFSAMLARYPGEDLTIIVLSNDDAAPVEKLSRELATALLGPADHP